MAEANTHEHLYEILKDFRTAMLVTRDDDGKMHGRPMAVAELNKDGQTYFATDAHSAKTAEAMADPNVVITFQSSSEFASLTGTLAVIRDRALIDRLWSDTWRVWFPDGKDDPNLVLLSVTPSEAEYWDNSGSEGLKYAFEAVTAYFKGRRPETDTSQNAKVKLRGV